MNSRDMTFVPCFGSAHSEGSKARRKATKRGRRRRRWGGSTTRLDQRRTQTVAKPLKGKKSEEREALIVDKEEVVPAPKERPSLTQNEAAKKRRVPVSGKTRATGSEGGSAQAKLRRSPRKAARDERASDGGRAFWPRGISAMNRKGNGPDVDGYLLPAANTLRVGPPQERAGKSSFIGRKTTGVLSTDPLGNIEYGRRKRETKVWGEWNSRTLLKRTCP